VNSKFLRTGIHSHDDGVIHWHAYTSAAVGDNAVLGVFLDNYEIEVTNESLKIPANQTIGFADEYVEGETQCNGEDAEVSVKAWDNFTDTGAGNRYIANMDRVHLDSDGMVFGIYFTPRDAEQVMPPWAADLPALGAVDTQQIRPEDLLGATTVPGSSVPAGDAPATTEAPATTGAPATTAG
jgi:hypothetical protein